VNVPISHRSFFRRLGKPGAAVITVLAFAGCGAAGASSGASHPSAAATTTSSAASPKPSAPVAGIDRLLAVSKQQYAAQVSGTHSIQTLHRLGHDPTLLRLLAARNLDPARAYIARQYKYVWYHWHVSRMRITQGSSLVSELGVPWVLPASNMTLRGPGGRSVGTLDVSMQDEIGFVRLMHRKYPKLQVVIRSERMHQLRTSMYSAAFVKLPATGTVAIRGTRYQVRSFQEKDWGGEPVTISLLMKG
jgi:hypothetical protein